MRNTKDVAEFIRTMAIELTDMARGADLPALGFILTLASLEAKRTIETPPDRPRRKSQRRSRAGIGPQEAGRPGERRIAAR
jgi:hypothetical protein